MTKQERIKALEEIIAKTRDDSIFGDCAPLPEDANTHTTRYSGQHSGDVLKLLRREPGW
jgi:hypothetical protein